MALSPQFLDELRDRTTLSTLIGRTVKLIRKGREYAACCPFHQEKSPSFYVNDEKGFYHCFGCSAHGDAIKWLTEARGLPFMDAVKELAATAGMEMPAPDPRAAAKAERAVGLTDAMEAAARWFQDQLAGIEGSEARAYLDKRGITAATIKMFGFGFAPDSRGKLRKALDSFGDQMLVDCGLLIAPEDNREPYDRFRGRLMIPIRDQRGRTIAFGGRIIGQGEPKYLNSPETALFDKGRTLYNLDRAAPAARRTGRVIVVEGYLDVIALAQAGIEEAVAPLGTALTEAQLERLWKLVDVPTLCFDGDKPGQKAAMRAAERAYAAMVPGQSLRFVTLPGGKDPDDVIREGGAAAFEAVATSPRLLVDLLWDTAAAGLDLAGPDGRAALRHRLDEVANGHKVKVIAEEYRRAFRDRFYQDFGWKRGGDRDNNRDGRGGGAGGPRRLPPGQRAVEEAVLRAVLVGLALWPRAIAAVAEPLSDLLIDDPLLSEVRDALLSTAITRPALDDGALRSILDMLRNPSKGDRSAAPELGYAFLKSADDTESAEYQLRELVELLAREQALTQEFERVAQRLIEDLSPSNYEALESRRQALREARAALLGRAYEIGSGPEEQV
ncbi:DNA primase [Sphingomonas zeicaulis]|uniref:DNA primase n=1 Tax=Sphingomonas zeicaulis TaxID=1632740 RepID=UPI003D21264F